MARPLRRDAPHLLHHVVNKGVGGRTVFEGEPDMALFLEALALAVTRDHVLVHAYCILPTHFHLLVESCYAGGLSAALKLAEQIFVQRYNWWRDRHGTMLQSRFFSKAVESNAYLWSAIYYIHENARAAGLVSRAADYPFCSAHHLARGRAPSWLSTEFSARLVEPSSLEGADAESIFGFVESRLASAPAGRDRVDPLVQGENADWTLKRAMEGDQRYPGIPVVAPDLVARLVSEWEAARGPWRLAVGGRRIPAWPVFGAGMLRVLGGCTYEEIGRRQQIDPSAARRRVVRHRAWVAEAGVYAKHCSDLTAHALEVTFGPFAHLPRGVACRKGV